MKRILAVTLALLLLAASGTQAQQTGKQQLLLLPLTLDLQDIDGMDAARFYATLEQQAETPGGMVDLVIPAANDPRLAGLDLTSEPDPATAVALGHKFGVPLVGWTKVEFRLQGSLKTFADGTVPGQQLQVGDPAPENLITVGGLAHLGVVDVGTGKVLMQGPLAVFRSAATRANQGTGNYEDDVQSVTLQCAGDLAVKIVEFARKRRPQS